MRPSSPRISTRACTYTGECGLDVTTAQCAPGIVSDDAFGVRYTGPTCGCSPTDQRCHLHWFDPVPCSSAADCWVAETPVLHAIARPARLGRRKFRGCVDGEHVPACVAGHCTLRGLKC